MFESSWFSSNYAVHLLPVNKGIRHNSECKLCYAVCTSYVLVMWPNPSLTCSSHTNGEHLRRTRTAVDITCQWFFLLIHVHGHYHLSCQQQGYIFLFKQFHSCVIFPKEICRCAISVLNSTFHCPNLPMCTCMCTDFISFVWLIFICSILCAIWWARATLSHSQATSNTNLHEQGIKQRATVVIVHT